MYMDVSILRAIEEEKKSYGEMVPVMGHVHDLRARVRVTQCSRVLIHFDVGFR